MLTHNTCVANGLANGTRATVKQVILKPGEQVHCISLESGISVDVVRASQVENIVLEHCNERIRPKIFKMAPKTYSISAKLPAPVSLRTKDNEKETLEMKILQAPVVSNNATTGHKLQGRGVDNLFVHSWSYVKNWPYAMLSRVKTMAGFKCREKLSSDLSKYSLPQKYSSMLNKFKERTPTFFSDDQYDDLLGLV